MKEVKQQDYLQKYLSKPTIVNYKEITGTILTSMNISEKVTKYAIQLEEFPWIGLEEYEKFREKIIAKALGIESLPVAQSIPIEVIDLEFVK